MQVVQHVWPSPPLTQFELNSRQFRQLLKLTMSDVTPLVTALISGIKLFQAVPKPQNKSQFVTFHRFIIFSAMTNFKLKHLQYQN